MRRPDLRIGLVNNMADPALRGTERQFASLLGAAAPDFDIRFQYFSLDGVPRGEPIRAYMAGRYADSEQLPGAGLDALIVTGAEPKAKTLDQEAFWPALSRLIDWTETSGVPAVWSCLAAHAAALRLDGVKRHKLPAKLSGVFACQIAEEAQPPAPRPSSWPAAPWIPALAGMSGLLGAKPANPMPRAVWTPHSRENDLAEEDLVARGYRVLTRSPEAGVDSFIRRGRSLSLFFQGHPEYDADTLLREYSRDVGRYLRGERPTHPDAPRNYFDPASLRALTQLAKRIKPKDGPDAMAAYSAVLTKAAPQPSWRASAVAIYRAWLSQITGVEIGANAAPLSKAS